MFIYTHVQCVHVQCTSLPLVHMYVCGYYTPCIVFSVWILPGTCVLWETACAEWCSTYIHVVVEMSIFYLCTTTIHIAICLWVDMGSPKTRHKSFGQLVQGVLFHGATHVHLLVISYWLSSEPSTSQCFAVIIVVEDMVFSLFQGKGSLCQWWIWFGPHLYHWENHWWAVHNFLISA